MGGPHGQKSVWATAHTVPAPMVLRKLQLESNLYSYELLFKIKVSVTLWKKLVNR